MQNSNTSKYWFKEIRVQENINHYFVNENKKKVVDILEHLVYKMI